jgi:hypothetical protein
MPDGTSVGSLEDLYLAAVREQCLGMSDTTLDCADAFVACSDPTQSWFFTRREKARLYAWLATRERPSVRPAQALLWQYVDHRNSAFDGIKAFLKQLADAAQAPTE